MFEPIPLSNTSKLSVDVEDKHFLNALLNNEPIVIKEIKKCGAVVIMDSNYYQSKIMNMLSDRECYQ